ncbi:MAG: polysaccharide biosynthesis protein [Clostridium sp.]|nr:polysaccharide biosynthesis protein [Clostridium sp.]
MLDLNSFISKYVTQRPESMFLSDINENTEKLNEKINGKTILVVGGAGSIGSSFIKAILPFKPKSLVVVDINENGLAELTRDLRSTKGLFIPDDYIPYPINFASEVFEKMFRSRKGFDIVANFSAHKHVRSEKDIFSVEALIRNNILNAKKLLDLLSEYKPEEYFCVSTDKAANPVNIMGASKRIMEDVIFSYSDVYPVKTARFANVAFSNGSLPAGFLERMQKRQPISAPFDVKRYFVSPEESGQICMLSAILGNNREIFFPKLKEAQMMSFDRIATNLLNESGYEVLRCSTEQEAIDQSVNLKNNCKKYPVIYSESDTSGEKLYEEFYIDSEQLDMGRFNSLGVIINKEIPDKEKINSLYNELYLIFEKNNLTKKDVVDLLSKYISNFEHIETGKSLDSKM